MNKNNIYLNLNSSIKIATFAVVENKFKTDHYEIFKSESRFDF